MASIMALTFLFAWGFFGLGTLFNAEYNRILMFKEPIPDKVLPGHVIQTEKVVNEGSCRAKCYLEPNCVAINVGPADEGGHICELKNFTDESSSHSALEDKKHYTHYSVENFCQSSPCHGMNSLCQVGFTDKGYRCVCRDGYKGYQCNEDIDECSDGSHNCGDASNCRNIRGSFYCVCKPGFVNDGVKCEALTLLVICEDSGTEQIKCDDGGTIAILSANFGRLDWTTCPHRKIKTNDCRANSSLDEVKEICQHKESCELQATRSFFGGDPCPGTYKYLLVEYKCDS